LKGKKEYSGMKIQLTPYNEINFLKFNDELITNDSELAEILSEEGVWYIGNYNNSHGMLMLSTSGKVYSIDVECSYAILFADSINEMFNRLFVYGEQKLVNGEIINWPIKYDDINNIFLRRAE